jgi:hypothetical protein
VRNEWCAGEWKVGMEIQVESGKVVGDGQWSVSAVLVVVSQA